ncbi:hypothetical protein M407DRAFT_26573 [Tulasnella calospora MUT 4182]|uniref:Uncharacterized protein n=1 Tax=Tulasnella calospora MUT 4182 TaxID=1051891 RepID=A0A0C3KRH4_9AGAM|nr:hypothetical protein M407DRAFT_26573 [Tulasnella calospora MUT 4182]
MSSAPHVERFKGAGWEECDEFISAIRARALWEGKQRDAAWKADFAAPLFSRKALAWHSRLPEDVREDWSKLEIALLEQWAPEDDDELQIMPTPAAASSLDRNDKAQTPLQGVLKVVLDRSTTEYYLRFTSNYCDLTTNASMAVRVRCNSLSSATLLERMDHSCHSWLAVHWYLPTPNIGNGSIDYAHIACVHSNTLKSSWSWRGPLQLLTCNILENGEVTPVWKKNDSSEIPLFVFVEGSTLYLVADPVVYGQNYGGETQAKLFIEPID